MTTDALIPVEAEQTLLGAMCDRGEYADLAYDVLTVNDFGVGLHARIFDELITARRAGSDKPGYIAGQALSEDVEYHDWGGTRALMQLADTAAREALYGIDEYLDIIASMSRKRQLRQRMDRASAMLTRDGDAACVELETALAAFGTTSNRKSDTETASDMMDASLAAIEEANDRGGPGGVVVPFLPEWNDLTGTMTPGEMIVLAGRPGMGKTAQALAVARGVAETGAEVLIISLEMRARELGQRMIADVCHDQQAGVSYADLLHGNARNMEAVRRAADYLRGLPLTISSNGTLTVERVGAMVRRHKRDCERRGTKQGLVIVDYLQRLRTDARTNGRYEAITHISESLKNMALDNEVPMLTLAQLSRAVEQRDDKRPMMSDLRDSGAIEQDADSIIFVYRPEYYLRQQEPDVSDNAYADWRRDFDEARNKLWLFAEKRRNGAADKKCVWFYGEYQAVRDFDFLRRKSVRAA